MTPAAAGWRSCDKCGDGVGQEKARTCAKCRKRTSRAKAAQEAAEVEAATPGRRLGFQRPSGSRCNSCSAFLSRYGGGGHLCWTCAFGSKTDPEDPDLDDVLFGVGRLDPLAYVLIRCGGWPHSSTKVRERVMNAALSLHITISDTTAGALIERFGSREGATDALAGLARQKRRPGLRGSARVADLRALERRIEEISAARSESLNQLNRRSAEAASRFLEQLVGSADAEHVSERLETLWRDIRQLRGLTEAAPQDPIRQQTVSVLRVFPPEPAEWLEAVAA